MKMTRGLPVLGIRKGYHLSMGGIRDIDNEGAGEKICAVSQCVILLQGYRQARVTIANWMKYLFSEQF